MALQSYNKMMLNETVLIEDLLYYKTALSF